MLQIEQDYNKPNRLKVTFKGHRYSIKVREGEVAQVVAHYFATKEHQPSICPVCKDIEVRESKGG